MKWYQYLWPPNWRAKSKNIEECETIDEMLAVVNKSSSEKRDKGKDVIHPGGVWQYVGMLWAWVVMLCGLNPWRIYSENKSDPHILFPADNDELHRTARVVATIFALVTGLYGAASLFPDWSGVSVHDSRGAQVFFLVSLTMPFISFVWCSAIALIRGFELHEGLQLRKPKEQTIKASILAHMQEKIAHVREQVLGKDSILEVSIAENCDRISELERKRAMFVELANTGALLSPEMIPQIDNAMAQFKLKDKILRSRVEKINQRFAQAEAHIHTWCPLFDQRALILETQTLINHAENIHVDIARIDAQLMSLLQKEFASIGRLVKYWRDRAYALPVEVDEQLLLEHAHERLIEDRVFDEGMRDLEDELIDHDPENPVLN